MCCKLQANPAPGHCDRGRVELNQRYNYSVQVITTCPAGLRIVPAQLHQQGAELVSTGGRLELSEKPSRPINANNVVPFARPLVVA